MGISKNLPFPLLWRGIKGEVKQIKSVFRDALIIVPVQNKGQLLIYAKIA